MSSWFGLIVHGVVLYMQAVIRSNASLHVDLSGYEKNRELPSIMRTSMADFSVMCISVMFLVASNDGWPGMRMN